MNSPQYVHLLVNPEDALIALCVCHKEDKDAIKVSSAGQRGEVYSKNLLNQILSLKGTLIEDHTYRLSGNLSQSGQIVFFHISDAMDLTDKGDFYD